MALEGWERYGGIVAQPLSDERAVAEALDKMIILHNSGHKCPIEFAGGLKKWLEVLADCVNTGQTCT